MEESVEQPVNASGERIKVNAAISLKRPFLLNQRLLECDIGKKCRLIILWRKTGAKTRVGQQPHQRHDIRHHQRNPHARERFAVPARVPAASTAAQFAQGSAASEAPPQPRDKMPSPAAQKATTAGTPGSKPSQKAS
jgi:hypothetical protein